MGGSRVCPGSANSRLTRFPGSAFTSGVAAPSTPAPAPAPGAAPGSAFTSAMAPT